MTTVLTDIVYLLALVLLSPLLVYRILAHQRYRTGWAQRFGFVPRRHGDQPRIWIHAVSMGEVNATVTLVDALHRTLPQYEIIFTTTTDTGMARARKLYAPDHRIFFYPWDFSANVNRFLDRLHPQLCILMEGEVWPNLTAAAARRDIPVVVANARVGGTKGWPRYQKIAPLVRPMFRRLSIVFAQDRTHAERFQFLGVPEERLQVVGALKYDTAEVTDQVQGAPELAQQLGLTDAPVWVAGQTGSGEEEIVLDSFRQLRTDPALAQLRLVIVPRKPERFDDVAKVIEARGHRLIRYSSFKNSDRTAQPEDAAAVILGDTMGDLRKFYSLARAIFIGRSLVPMGGSDMMEVAALAQTVVVGPHTENFTETVKHLKAGAALLEVADTKELTDATARLLTDEDYARQTGAQARKVILDHKGATQRTLASIVDLLGYQMPAGPQAIATPKLRA